MSERICLQIHIIHVTCLNRAKDRPGTGPPPPASRLSQARGGDQGRRVHRRRGVHGAVGGPRTGPGRQTGHRARGRTGGFRRLGAQRRTDLHRVSPRARARSGRRSGEANAQDASRSPKKRRSLIEDRIRARHRMRPHLGLSPLRAQGEQAPRSSRDEGGMGAIGYRDLQFLTRDRTRSTSSAPRPISGRCARAGRGISIPSNYCDGLARAASDAGAVIYEQSRVNGWKYGGRAAGLDGDGPGSGRAT